MLGCSLYSIGWDMTLGYSFPSVLLVSQKSQENPTKHDLIMGSQTKLNFKHYLVLVANADSSDLPRF